MAHQPTFLCVDDDPSVLLMEKMLLESAGFRVLTASSGPEAIRTIESEKIDVVVMDYRMPGMTGIKAAQTIKQRKPETLIVFLSAYSELPGETLGVGEWWAKKGEQQPEHFLANLSALLRRAPRNVSTQPFRAE